MAECCVRSPARTFCQESSLIEEVPGLANAPRTEGGRCKKSIPAGSWPFSPQEHLSSSLQCLPQLPCPPPPAPVLLPAPFPNPQVPGTVPLRSYGCPPSSLTRDSLWILRTFPFLPYYWNPPFSTLKSFYVKVRLWIFFFIVSTHIFLKCLCSPWSVSNPATPDSEVPIGLRGLFSPIRLSPVNHWGIWHSRVSFTPATEQLNTLSCRPGADIWTTRTNAASPETKANLLLQNLLMQVDKDGSQPKARKQGESSLSSSRVALGALWAQSRNQAAECPADQWAHCVLPGTRVTWRSCWQAIQNGTPHHKWGGSRTKISCVGWKKWEVTSSIYKLLCFLIFYSNSI